MYQSLWCFYVYFYFQGLDFNDNRQNPLVSLCEARKSLFCCEKWIKNNVFKCPFISEVVIENGSSHLERRFLFYVQPYFFWKEFCKILSYLFLGREFQIQEQLIIDNMGQSLIGTSVLVNIENFISFSLFFNMAVCNTLNKNCFKIFSRYCLVRVTNNNICLGCSFSCK